MMSKVKDQISNLDGEIPGGVFSCPDLPGPASTLLITRESGPGFDFSRKTTTLLQNPAWLRNAATCYRKWQVSGNPSPFAPGLRQNDDSPAPLLGYPETLLGPLAARFRPKSTFNTFQPGSASLRRPPHEPTDPSALLPGQPHVSKRRTSPGKPDSWKPDQVPPPGAAALKRGQSYTRQVVRLLRAYPKKAK